MTSTKTQRTIVFALLSTVVLGIAIGGVVTAQAWPGANPSAPVGGPLAPSPAVTQTQPAQPVQQAPAPVAPASSVDEQQAIAIAIAHAGLAADQVTLVRAHRDYDDRTPVWDVEFYSGTTEYDYEIAVDTGAVRSYDRDIENYSAPRPPATQPAPSQPSVPQQPASAQMISLDEAKAIALAKVPGATNVRAEFDRDDRRPVYEGEVFKDGWEYDFEIDARTGAILEWGSEPIDD